MINPPSTTRLTPDQLDISFALAFIQAIQSHGGYRQAAEAAGRSSPSHAPVAVDEVSIVSAAIAYVQRLTLPPQRPRIRDLDLDLNADIDRSVPAPEGTGGLESKRRKIKSANDACLGHQSGAAESDLRESAAVYGELAAAGCGVSR